MTDDDRADRFPLDSSPGPAAPISEQQGRALVVAAIAAAGLVAKPAVRTLRPSRRTWAILLAAALVLVLGSALAAVLPHLLRKEEVVPPVVQPVLSTPPEGTSTSAVAPTASIPPAPEPIATTGVSAPVVEQPADLLRRANGLRKEHKWQDAETTYERVMARSPHGDEGYAATVAAASIRLDHLGDAAGALRLYRAALSERPSGTLSEEARWGIAEGERVLGDRAGEIEALRAFITAHPDGVMRPSAEARLQALGAK